LLYASRILDFVDPDNFDEKIGINILKEALRKPIELMAKNGEQNGKLIIDTLLEKYNDNVTGYNFKTSTLSLRSLLTLDKFVNMFEDGVIDSFKVVKTVLEDACAIGKNRHAK